MQRKECQLYDGWHGKEIYSKYNHMCYIIDYVVTDPDCPVSNTVVYVHPKAECTMQMPINLQTIQKNFSWDSKGENCCGSVISNSEVNKAMQSTLKQHVDTFSNFAQYFVSNTDKICRVEQPRCMYAGYSNHDVEGNNIDAVTNQETRSSLKDQIVQLRQILLTISKDLESL